MSQYIVTFEVGWMKIDAEGDSPAGLIQEVENVQDLQCLCNQAAMLGTKKDMSEVRKLLEFLEKHNNGLLTIEDVRNLDVKLSVGRIRCVKLAENE